MINDSERREIAARLREQRVWDIFTNFEDCIGDICDAVFDDEGDLNDMFRLQKALADLIDPTCKVKRDNRFTSDFDYVCLACGEHFSTCNKPNYCPGCGARVVDEDD